MMNADAQGFLAQHISRRSFAIGEQILETATNIRSMADQLRKDVLTQKAAELADIAATRTEQFGKYLQESDVDTMLTDAQAFSRKRPLTVAFGGFILGLGTARILKAGASRSAFDTRLSAA